MTNISTSNGSGAVMQSVVSVEVETLTAFRDRVNGLLTALEGGPAGPTRIAAQRLAAGHLGSDFQEVGHLMARYQLVHSQLQSLSTTLTNQINAMGIALQVTQLGYQHVEAETLDTLWAIQNRAAATPSPVAVHSSSTPSSTATPTGHRSS
jgi:hypothetical protein